jgi:mannosyltransferase OCH1-like enzyme
VKKLKLINQQLYDYERNYGAKSDILRIEILYKYGGLYVDTDFECLNPDAFKQLHSLYDFYAGFHPADFRVFCLVNALIGARPGHPVLKGYLEELRTHYHTSTNILAKTGPGFFTLMFLKHAGKSLKDKDIAFGPSYFYPVSLSQVYQIKQYTQQALKSPILFPESVAFHWWEGSWWGTH